MRQFPAERTCISIQSVLPYRGIRVTLYAAVSMLCRTLASAAVIALEECNRRDCASMEYTETTRPLAEPLMHLGMLELVVREDIARYCRAILSTFVATPHGKVCCVSTGVPSINGRLRLITCNGSGGIPYTSDTSPGVSHSVSGGVLQ